MVEDFPYMIDRWQIQNFQEPVFIWNHLTSSNIKRTGKRYSKLSKHELTKMKAQDSIKDQAFIILLQKSS